MATALDLDAAHQSTSHDERRSEQDTSEDDERYVVQLMPRDEGAVPLVESIERMGANPRVEIHGVKGRTTTAALCRKLCKRWREQGVPRRDMQLELYAGDMHEPFAEDVRVRKLAVACRCPIPVHGAHATRAHTPRTPAWEAHACVG